MGMMIDESKAILGGRLENPLEGDLAKEAFSTAIDTMRKYQKIEQIIKDIPYGGDVTVRRIQEVLEDGCGAN